MPTLTKKRPKHTFSFHHPLILLLSLVLLMVPCVFLLSSSSLRRSSKLADQRQPLIILSNFPDTPKHRTHNGSMTVDSRHQLMSLPSSSVTVGSEPGPYHNWNLFAADFEEMMRSFKIYVYSDAMNSSSSSPYSNIFLPHPNPYDPKLGNYFSEHMFKVSLLQSSLLTRNPEEAHLYFMPFSINNLRNDRRVHSEESISDFVAQYAIRIREELGFWNASLGTDHFYAHCHSVGRDAASKHPDLLNNAIQVTCSSSYFQRFYIAHKDVALPQVWPRQPEQVLTPPSRRKKLVFFSGRIQNSEVRKELISLWENDTSMDVFSGRPPYSYEDGFRSSRYCLHVKGYEVNTARVSDAIHYGCIPVIISNYYDLPFASVLDWSKFSVIISHGEVKVLKERLLSIPREVYLSMYQNLCQVRRHFVWHSKPSGYDSFHMTAYQLWLRRSVHRLTMIPH